MRTRAYRNENFKSIFSFFEQKIKYVNKPAEYIKCSTIKQNESEIALEQYRNMNNLKIIEIEFDIKLIIAILKDFLRAKKKDSIITKELKI